MAAGAVGARDGAAAQAGDLAGASALAVDGRIRAHHQGAAAGAFAGDGRVAPGGDGAVAAIADHAGGAAEDHRPAVDAAGGLVRAAVVAPVPAASVADAGAIAGAGAAVVGVDLAGVVLRAVELGGVGSAPVGEAKTAALPGRAGADQLDRIGGGAPGAPRGGLGAAASPAAVGRRRVRGRAAAAGEAQRATHRQTECESAQAGLTSRRGSRTS